MPIALDGFEVLRQLGKHAELFSSIRVEVDKQARALVTKCLKSKSVGLDALHDIRKALGKEQFDLLVEGLKDTDVKGIVSRIDKHHPEIKGGSAAWRRQHLSELANGASTPQAPPAKAKKGSGKKKEEPARLHNAVVDAYASKKDR